MRYMLVVTIVLSMVATEPYPNPSLCLMVTVGHSKLLGQSPAAIPRNMPQYFIEVYLLSLTSAQLFPFNYGLCR